MVSSPLKNISQNGNLPQIGVNIKNIWNHHPETIFLPKDLESSSTWNHWILNAHREKTHLSQGEFFSLSRPGPWRKKFERLIFPTKYGILKSSKGIRHWLSKFLLPVFKGRALVDTMIDGHFTKATKLDIEARLDPPIDGGTQWDKGGVTFHGEFTPCTWDFSVWDAYGKR